MKKSFTLVILMLTILFIGCSHSNNVRRRLAAENITRENLKKDSSQARALDVIYGSASYYGRDFHGKKTANGETFDMYALTAAHKTLPFGTICKVTNLENHKTVIVRINDRGPFVDNRILDLSRGAADALGLIDKGVCRVKIDILSYPPSN